MKQKVNPLLRRLLLSCIYALGVFFIVASGGGDGSSSSDDCRLEVSAIAPSIDASNDIWIAAYSISSGEKVNSVVRLDSAGAEKLWVPVGNGRDNVIRTVAVATDAPDTDKVYVGGDFNEGIFRLNPDGSLDNSFVVGSGFNGSVTRITAAEDGSGDIYVAGYFDRYNSILVSGLVRLTKDGSLDGTFSTITQAVEDVELAGGLFAGDYVYSGGFGSVGDSASRLVRWRVLDGGRDDGSLPPSLSFTTNIGPVLSVVPALDIDDSVYAGGGFANGIIRLTNRGIEDASFNVGTGFDDDVRKILRADAGTDIYAVGGFTTYNGARAMGIARLDEDGSPDAGFITGGGFTRIDGSDPFEEIASAAISSVPANTIYVGGDFSLYDGIARNGIARLNGDGSLDMGFAVELTSTETECNNETIPGLD